jgi:hypothetical protein
MVSIIIGIIMIIGGLSGKLVLIGTNSGVALAVLGAALVVWGIIKMVRQSRGGGNNNQQ